MNVGLRKCLNVFMSFWKHCRGMSQLGRDNCSLLRKPFIVLSIHGCWPRPHHITINLWREDILYHTVYWNAGLLNWRNCSSNDLRLLHPESSSAVTLLLHADWMMLKNASNQGGANSVTVAPFLSFSHEIPSVDAGRFSEIIWRSALGFSTDLRLNTTRRSINLSVYLLFDLEARRFKFLGENLLDAGAVENELSTLDS